MFDDYHSLATQFLKLHISCLRLRGQCFFTSCSYLST
uniref:Uncharacterized protein n=1 Tax=Arundo donax TaxID=35708 RepID=A0A0A9AQY1_ARUDO